MNNAYDLYSGVSLAINSNEPVRLPSLFHTSILYNVLQFHADHSVFPTPHYQFLVWSHNLVKIIPFDVSVDPKAY